MAQATAKKRNETADAAKQGFHGTFCWNELMTRDIEGAKRFYRDTIGWSFEPMKMDWGTYWIAKSGDKNVGGMFELKGPEFDGVPNAGCPMSPSMTSMPASPRRRGRRQAHAADLRCAGRRPHRHPDAARWRRRRLDDAEA
jgi:hypothetical protein